MRRSDRLVKPTADEAGARRAQTQAIVVHGCCESRYGARFGAASSGGRSHRGHQPRSGYPLRGNKYRGGRAPWTYDRLYYAPGQGVNLTTLHKTRLASDHTSCRSPLANQMRPVLHTGA